MDPHSEQRAIPQRGTSYAQQPVASCWPWVTKTHEDAKSGSRRRRNRRSMSWIKLSHRSRTSPRPRSLDRRHRPGYV